MGVVATKLIELSPYCIDAYKADAAMSDADTKNLFIIMIRAAAVFISSLLQNASQNVSTTPYNFCIPYACTTPSLSVSPAT